MPSFTRGLKTMGDLSSKERKQIEDILGNTVLSLEHIRKTFQKGELSKEYQKDLIKIAHSLITAFTLLYREAPINEDV